MSLSSTSEILNILGDPVTNQQFHDLLGQFCQEEKNILGVVSRGLLMEGCADTTVDVGGAS